MWKVPATAPEALPYLVDAARRDGYLGLMVILARTAEARTLHDELVRDWTSIHDVTGHRIAVLCPDPRFVLSDAKKHGTFYATENSVSRYWSGLRLDEALDIPHTRVVVPGDDGGPRGVPVAFPPNPAEIQQAAWTEAVTGCASHFGVRESRLPAVLVLCLREERDVLIQLRGQTSLYRLCKRIASHPGYEPGDDHRLSERARLTDLVERLKTGHGRLVWMTDDAPRTMRELQTVAKVRAQFDGLRKHLSMVAHVDLELNRRWSTGLDELVDSDADDKAVLAYLSEMVRTVNTHPRQVDLRRLDKKAHKVERAVSAATNPPAKLRSLPESPAAKTEREAERARAQAELAELELVLDSRPGLATACETAAKAELGTCEIAPLELAEYVELLRGYPTERIHAVSPVGHPPDDATVVTHNDLSGTVHGPAVQAGHIDDLHLHVHRRWLGAWRQRRRRR